MTIFPELLSTDVLRNKQTNIQKQTPVYKIILFSTEMQQTHIFVIVVGEKVLSLLLLLLLFLLS